MEKKTILLIIGGLGLAAGGYFLLSKNSSSNSTIPSGNSSGGSAQQSASSSGYSLPSTTAGSGTSSWLSKYPAGTLLRGGKDAAVYVMGTDGLRHWVTGDYWAKNASSKGWSMNNVQTIAEAERDQIPRGADLKGLSGLGSIYLIR
jgi:hypothetical protein